MRRSAVVVVTAASAPLRCEAGIDVRPWQLCGNGRNGWSTKLIRGLVTEAATGFQSRRGRCREPTPVTRHYAPFPTYKAVRRAIQHSQESLRALAKRYGINQKTVRKWKARSSVSDLRTGPKEPRSTVLTVEEEAVVVAFRRHTLLPLDDCLYALQPTIPHLTRSSLHRCLQRHGISRLPAVEGEASPKTKFKSYPIGFFHIDIAEVRTAEGKLYMLVAIDRTSKFAFVELHRQAKQRT